MKYADNILKVNTALKCFKSTAFFPYLKPEHVFAGVRHFSGNRGSVRGVHVRVRLPPVPPIRVRHVTGVRRRVYVRQIRAAPNCNISYYQMI